ncbi:hypothetical protein PCE1_000298 [Barthelona sp. PCE]
MSAPRPVYNFSAGPSCLPMAVLEQAQQEFLSFDNSGMSVVELSHRSAYYSKIHKDAIANLKTLLDIPDNYKVLFVQGGATSQFSCIPMNLMGTDKTKTADYVITGSWSKKAYDEAVQLGYNVNIAAKTDYTRLPTAEEYTFNPEASYVHICDNETICGVCFDELPNVPEGVPIVADMSSNILSKPIDVSKFGMIYGGAQKNVGPSGMTIVIIREDLIQKVPGIPIYMQYHLQASKDSLYNTPCTFATYMAGLVFKWLLEHGGLPWIHAINQQKADLIYGAIDDSEGFYRAHIAPENKNCRSIMNITFFSSDELTPIFLEEAAKEDLQTLKGHRSLGPNLRASIYNAMPLEGVQKLVDFMNKFREQHC